MIVRRLVFGIALAAGAVLAHGQTVGRVLLAAGDTVAVRGGQPVRLQFNSTIEAKDVLRTGPASSLQVRFSDEGLISLRENSELAIEEYRFAGKEDGSERGFFSLVKGGFRAVTGAIGRTQNSNYRVRTETATIGIRGTDYAVRDCRGECGAGVRDGLYGTVMGMSSGTNRVTLSNNTGEHVFGINQHFHVANANSRPEPLLQPPTFVSLRPQGKGQAAQQGGTGSGSEQASGSSGVAAESRPQSVIDSSAALTTTTYTTPYTITNTSTASGQSTLLPGGDIGLVGALVANGPSQGGGGGLGTSGQFETGTQGSFTILTKFTSLINDEGSFSGTKGSLLVVDPGCVNLPGAGCLVASSEPNMVMVWGRWQDGMFTDNEGTTNFGSSSGGLHYLGGFGITPYSVIAGRSGVATFQPVGGTVPTNNSGETAISSSFGNVVVTFGANPGATLTGFSMLFSTQQYTFSNIPLSITSEQGGKLASIGHESTTPMGTCTGSCATTGSIVKIDGGFAGSTGNHAGLAVTTQNGTVFTGQVKVLKCASGAC